MKAGSRFLSVRTASSATAEDRPEATHTMARSAGSDGYPNADLDSVVRG